MINLLPSAEKEKVQVGLLKRQLDHFGILILAVFLGGTIFIFNTFVFLKIQTKEIKNSLNIEGVNLDTKTAKALENDIRDLNQILARYQAFRQETKPALAVLYEVQKKIPLGIKITALSLDITTGKITLNGRAQNREDILSMEKQIKESKSFEKLESPLSNFLEKTNASFSFSFYVK